MIVRLYAIRDVLNGFMAPIVDFNDDAAKRNFAYSINNPGVMNFSPRDYDLYYLGTFNNETGIFETKIPDLVCHGTDVIGVGLSE